MARNRTAEKEKDVVQIGVETSPGTDVTPATPPGEFAPPSTEPSAVEPAPAETTPAEPAAVERGCTPPVLRDILQIPEGDVLLRKVKGPAGTNSWLGYVKVGRVYCLSALRSISLLDGGEFEVLPDWQPEIDAERERLARVQPAQSLEPAAK